MNAATKPVTNTAPRRRAMPVIAFALLLGGCAVSPLAPQSARLFNDDAFPAPSERPDAAEVFALNDAMRAYLRTDIAASAKQMGPQQASSTRCTSAADSSSSTTRRSRATPRRPSTRAPATACRWSS